MNAAELDRVMAAARAYGEAKAAGATEREAQDAARAAAEEKHRQQVLRSVGLSDAEIEACKLVPENDGKAA